MIQTEVYKPNHDKRGFFDYVCQRTAGEIFDELEERLKASELYPDEYFLLDYERGEDFSKEYEFLYKVDYGGSEGVYLDIYLNTYDGEKTVFRHFATGKTLQENGEALDRMFLIAGACQKAFSEEGRHARYICIKEAELQPEPSDHTKVTNAIRAGDQFGFYRSIHKCAGGYREFLYETIMRGGRLGLRMTEEILEHAKLDAKEYETIYFTAIDGGHVELATLLQRRAAEVTGDICSDMCYNGMITCLNKFSYMNDRCDRKIFDLALGCSQEQLLQASDAQKGALMAKLIRANMTTSAVYFVNMRSMSETVERYADILLNYARDAENDRVIKLLGEVSKHQCEGLERETVAHYYPDEEEDEDDGR